MRVKLTALRYGDLDNVRGEICKGNLVYIVRRPDKDKYGEPGELAYEVLCKNVSIGYIPLISTLEGYWRDAKTKDGRESICKWGLATRAVRAWLFSQVTYQMRDENLAKIGELLFCYQGEYSTKERGTLSQIAIDVEEV